MTTPSHSRFRRVLCRLHFTAIFIAVATVVSAAGPTKKQFRLEAEPAEKSLKTFSEQSGLEVLFRVGTVTGVRTNAVSGEMTAQEALNRMLSGTRLVAIADDKTGSVSIRADEDAGPNVASRRATEAAQRSDGKRGSPLQLGETVLTPKGTGIITGRVFNQSTGAMLEAATIQVANTEIRKTTARGGEFIIVAPAGTHALMAHYSGLNDQLVDVTVEAGKRVFVEIPMNAEYYQLDPVKVEGLREGQSKSVELQRNAVNLKTVVATDAFGTGESASPAMLLSRVAGFGGHDYIAGTFYFRGFNQNFTVLSLDGNDFLPGSKKGDKLERGVAIDDVLAMDNISTVEIIRAATPDMTASAVAGQFNLVSKRPFDNPGRHVSMIAGTTWTNIGNPTTPSYMDDNPGADFLSVTYQDTFSVQGGRNNLGVYFNASRRNVVQGGDNSAPNNAIRVQNAFIDPTPANGLSSTLVRGAGGSVFYNEFWQYGYALNFDFKTRNNTYVYFRNNMAYNTHGPQPWCQYGVSVSTGTDPATAFAPGSTWDFETALPIPASRALITVQSGATRFATYGTSVGFERKSDDGSGELSADLSYANNRHWSADWGQVDWGVGGIGWTLDRRGQDRWLPKLTQTSGPNIYDPASYPTPSGILRQRQSSPMERVGLRADWRKDFNSLKVPVYIKAGLAVNDMRGSQDKASGTYTYTGPVGNMKAYVQSTPFTTSKGRYGPFFFPVLPGSGGKGDLTDIEANANVLTQTSADAYNTANMEFRNDAKFAERIAGTYVMTGMTWRKLRVLGGVRMERTDVSAKAYAAKTSAAAGTTSITSLPPAENAARALKQFTEGMKEDKGDYTNFFPGVHVVYEPRNRWQFRASYNKSISRPNVSNLLPINTIDDSNFTVRAGNPDLKPFTSNNYDLALQRYFQKGVGYFSIAVFHKNLSNYSSNLSSTIGSGAENGFGGLYSGYTLTQQRNNGASRMRGIEIGYEQQYTALPGFWRGFGTFANYSFVEAKRFSATGATTGTTGQMEGIRPRLVNGGISYVGYGLELRLIGNWTGRWLSLDQGNTLLNGYNEASSKIDVKSLYRITDRYTVYFDIENVTNSPYAKNQVRYNGQPFQAFWLGALYSTGVRMNF